MAILDQIMNMKSQGLPEDEIIERLQEQGISPRQISDALNQVQVKNAVSGQNNLQNEKMNTSIENELPPPRPEEFPEQEHYEEEQYIQQPMQSSFQPQRFQPNFYQPEQNYGEGDNVDTMIEVAEQVFAEKMSEIGKQLDSLKELKTLTGSKIEHIEERLRKIEGIINRLQIDVLKKVSSYGDNLQSIKNEMSMMQNSFGKIVNTQVNKKPVTKKKATKKISKKSNKKKK